MHSRIALRRASATSQNCFRSASTGGDGSSTFITFYLIRSKAFSKPLFPPPSCFRASIPRFARSVCTVRRSFATSTLMLTLFSNLFLSATTIYIPARNISPPSVPAIPVFFLSRSVTPHFFDSVIYPSYILQVSTSRFCFFLLLSASRTDM